MFRTELDVIGPLPRPITILVSGDDKALALSTALGGGVERVGRVTADDARAVAAAKRYNLRVIDLTGVHVGDGNHHSKFAQSGGVLAAIGRGLASEAKIKSPSGTATAVMDAGSSILQLPATLSGTAE